MSRTKRDLSNNTEVETLMVDPQRIALVANTTWNIANFRKNIMEALHNEGFEVLVVSPVDEYLDEILQYEYVKHVPIKHLSRKGINPFQDLRLLFELSRIYKKEKIDLTIHYTIKPNIYGSLASRRNSIPTISAITGLGYTFIHNGLINKISKTLYRLALQYNEKVIFENHDDRILFIKAGLITQDQGISVKGCGINTQHFRPMPRKLEQEQVVFTFIGRLLYDKGIKEFVEAAKKVKVAHPEVAFWVLGDIDKDNPAAIKQQELDNWINDEVIVYKGFVRDVRTLIRESDCVVLPSYREAIPRAIQEGMAMGKPVISTDVAGCREAIEEGKNGYLVPIRDANALADAMLKFMALSEAAQENMGQYGRQKVLKEFDDRIIAQHFVDTINLVFNQTARQYS